MRLPTFLVPKKSKPAFSILGGSVLLILCFCVYGFFFGTDSLTPRLLTVDGSAHWMRERAQEYEELGSVIYAIKDVPEGYVIDEDALEMREISTSKIPADATSDLDSVIGHIAKYGLSQGQIVSTEDLGPLKAMTKHN